MSEEKTLCTIVPPIPMDVFSVVARAIADYSKEHGKVAVIRSSTLGIVFVEIDDPKPQP